VRDTCSPHRLTCAAMTLGLVLISHHAAAQSAWTYRTHTALETTSTHVNPSSPAALPSRTWNTAGLFVAAGDAAWDRGDRLRVGIGALATGAAGDVDFQVREAYARVSAASWMDAEAGKRLLRWGVAYGFAPTGVLDPPRATTDPTDRLGRNTGMWLARVDVFRGATSLTVAAAAPKRTEHDPVVPDRIVAARLRTVVGPGVEIALIAAASRRRRASYGGNVTHVLGQQLEWHGELLVHDGVDGAGRTYSAAAGVQYTFTAGANIIVEYHRNGRGLTEDRWNAVLRGERAPGAAPARRQFLFFRVANAAAASRLAPELIAVAGLDDGGWTLAPGITWTAHAHVQLYTRATRLLGPRRSIVRNAPWNAALTIGASVRY
jgi:hypothetical protein